jgi:pimeloyl-ACP methyl ester carboxylesterase
MTPRVLDGVRDLRLHRPDGRTVAWTEWGPDDGIPLLRVPGTPGSRFGLRADRSVWAARGLRAITTERPGFGASSRLPGRGFNEHADDLAAVLDAAGVDRAHVIGGSGSSPHQLAFAARHPDRVRAMTILVGAAPETEEEYAQLVGVNQEAHRLVTSGDIEGLHTFLGRLRKEIVADPLAAFQSIMETAPDADREVMSDPKWQESFIVAMSESMAQGVEGWADESIALDTRWDDIDLDAVTTSVTWWHAASDANTSFTAAKRLVAQLANARMELFPEHEGHMAGYHREAEILDELLGRG